ncbi:hypothetical protein EUTSA_v10012343mg [Eutrema salsugineum]|uniref:TF-B3 domain-containing protein n=1 Tax=Eutrema salsugineum TaxID=72664 RepID=V4KKE0_EUTSA|nr:hypothetical protein EUTSA_v10012343mg [Eutrema salsugineum]
MKKDDYYQEPSSQPNKYWKLDILADVAAREYSSMINLEILVKVASAMLEEYETSKNTLVSPCASLPRKKTSQLSHRPASTQWVKNKSIACVDYKQEEEDKSFKKRKIVGRCKVGSSSTSTKEQKVLENLDWDPESLPSSCITECSKKKCPPTNISCKKLKIVHRGPTQTTNGQPNPPEWLLNLIITKHLFQSDLDKGKNRLQMPINQLVNTNFLTEEETRIIYEKLVLTRETGLIVVLVDPLSKGHVVDFRKWKMGKNWFKVGDVYSVWSFRSGQGNLCFALVPDKFR